MGSLADSYKHASIVEVITVTAEPSNNTIPDTDQTSSLKDGATDEITSGIIVGKVAFETDWPPGDIL
jgi:hypothetical protein